MGSSVPHHEINPDRSLMTDCDGQLSVSAGTVRLNEFNVMGKSLLLVVCNQITGWYFRNHLPDTVLCQPWQYWSTYRLLQTTCNGHRVLVEDGREPTESGFHPLISEWQSTSTLRGLRASTGA